MADISKIQINDELLDIKDEVARNLLNNISINVKSFGAMGDNETDDTDAINDALDYLSDNGGGTLFIPSGTYLISDTLIVPSNVTLQGNGKTTIIKASEFNDNPTYKTMIRNANFQMITENNNTENICIRDLVVENNGDANAGHDGLIQFRGLINSSVKNVTFKVNGNNCWGLLLFSANKNIDIDNVTINNISEDNSLGGCLWIRSGLISYGNDNKKSYGIHVSNSYFTSTAKDEVIAITSGVSGGWTEASITNCTLIGKAETNYASFLIAINAGNSVNDMVKCELNNLNLLGRVNHSAIMIGYAGTGVPFNRHQVVANNITIDLENGNGLQSEFKEQVFNNCLITVPATKYGAYKCTIMNSVLYSQAYNCNVYNCYINTGTSNDACCNECEKVIGSELHTTGSGIAIYGKRTVQFMNNQIYADSYGIRSNKNNSNEALENSIISGNYLRRNSDSDNTGSIGIYVNYSKYTQLVNNRIMGVAGNATGNYFGYNYTTSTANSVSLTQTENNSSYYNV